MNQHETQNAFEKISGLTRWNGKIIGSFICDEIREYYPIDKNDPVNKPYGDKIEIDTDLTTDQINNYALEETGYGKLYGLHISNFVRHRMLRNAYNNQQWYYAESEDCDDI